MNKDSRSYTIIYASVLVVIVAFGLATTNQLLRDKQIDNVNNDKKQQILRSLRMEIPAEQAGKVYSETIVNAYLVNSEGLKIEGSDGIESTSPAFNADLAKDTENGLPVFEAQIDGKPKYILQMSGKGLWGAIWGYASVESDGSTIYGIDFSHAGETPGLGAEITHEPFRKQFEGKHLFKEGKFTSIAIVKIGKTTVNRDYVDGLSGGTITSQGVDHMIEDCMRLYEPFLTKLAKTDN